jgi:TonB family protein
LFIGVQEHALATDTAALAQLRAEDAAMPALARANRQLAVSALRARSLLDDASDVSALERQVAALENKAGAGAGLQRGGVAGSAPRSAAPNDPAPFDISKIDVMPRLLRQARPLPPEDLTGAAASGEALVDFIIGTDGSVHGAAVLHSSNRAFEPAALDAVNQWVFSPGQAGGQNVSVHMQVPIVFSPSSEPPPATAATWF